MGTAKLAGLAAAAVCLACASAFSQIVYVSQSVNIGSPQEYGAIQEFTLGGASVGSIQLGSTHFPEGLAFDASGNLYIADEYTTSGMGHFFSHPQILKVAPGGGTSVFAVPTYAPNGLAFDSTGNLYVSEQFQIEKFTPTGVESTFATLDGNPQDPGALAFDRAGDLCAIVNNSIEVFAPGGGVSTFATGLNSASGLSLDTSGNIYVSQFLAGDIEEFAPNGSESLYATGLVAANGLAFAPNGDLYVAAISGLTKVSPDGAFETLASISNSQYVAISPAPEPATLSLFALGAAALLRRRGGVGR